MNIDLSAATAEYDAALTAYFAAARRRREAAQRLVAATVLTRYPTAAVLEAEGEWETMDDFCLHSTRLLDAKGQPVPNAHLDAEAWDVFCDEIDPLLSKIADLGGPEQREEHQRIQMAEWLAQPRLVCAKCGGPVIIETDATGEPEYIHDGSEWPNRDAVHDFRYCGGDDADETLFVEPTAAATPTPAQARP